MTEDEFRFLVRGWLAHVADWCFLLVRTQAGWRRSAGLSRLLVPMRQRGITVKPIRQLVFGQLIAYRRELGDLVERARRSGAASDSLIRDRLAWAFVGLETLRAYALDTAGDAEHLEADSGSQASVLKLLWARWHKTLGELARADTIYGGSDEIQLAIIANREFGLAPGGWA